MLKSNGCIIFNTSNCDEVLKIESKGDFYVKGRKTTNDKEVYLAFKK